MKTIARLLIANRGEIAVRIIRACKALGIESVLAVSEADRDSLPATMADRAVCIGPARAADSYLKIDALVTACLGTGAQALHPGYGFLAENPELAEACATNGITFVGPAASHIRRMGNKISARALAAECGVATLPGSEGVEKPAQAEALARKTGFPVLLKAAGGGGGRGMRIVHAPAQLPGAFDEASGEAQAAFGDGTIYLEHYIANARHIEVQVLGDQFGNVIHAGERDCSVQRRFQKVIEEAPSPAVSEPLRAELCGAAVTLAQKLGYSSVGTVEFILDRDNGRFYFLEMNTRIQVEHPVTEQITGIDLVAEQINAAAGNPLGLTQSDVGFGGHAIECRINAESAERGFAPTPGRIADFRPPAGAGIRVETHCQPGTVVPPYYDSLIAKVIASGKDRVQAAERMRKALAEFAITGLETNLAFQRRLLDHADFRDGNINTRWLEDVIMGTHRSEE
ncbi:MAG: acetyl-CoA carboxylase biotin carboxylase subunit [bacterium]